MFHDYLSSTCSICLPASFRWAIALETRHCLTGCKGCNELNEGRKQISRAEFRVDGKVTASAEGLFICSDELQKPPTGDSAS